MNIILLEQDEVDGSGRAVLTGRRARHICGVLRVTPGDRVRVGAIRGPRGRATVIALDGQDRVELDIDWTEPASPIPSVALVLAVPRPKVLKRTVRAAACLGVRRIDLVNAWRVDKSYLSSHALAPHALHDSAMQGCEQAGTTWRPDVHVHPRLMRFVHGELSDQVQDPDSQFLVAHPGASETLDEALLSTHVASRHAAHGRREVPSRLIAAIGPERGWIDRELQSFADLGGRPVALCDPTLSVELAVTSLLSQVLVIERLDAKNRRSRWV